MALYFIDFERRKTLISFSAFYLLNAIEMAIKIDDVSGYACEMARVKYMSSAIWSD